MAIEYIKFYNPQLTDENCNDLLLIETRTDDPTTETTTDVPATEFSTDVPTTEYTTDVPTTEFSTDVPTTETATDVLTTEFSTDVPTTETSTDVPTTETSTDVPTTEYTTATASETPAGNQPCLKVDFNQSSLDQFQECNGQYLPRFIQKPYSTSSVLPFRNASNSYLSNKWEGLSCIESIKVFSLNEASVVESAIYLNGLWPGAWIQVYIIDEKSGDRQNLMNLEPHAAWNIMAKNITRTFDDARV